MAQESVRDMLFREIIRIHQISEEDTNRILDEFDEFRRMNSPRFLKAYEENRMEDVLEVFNFIPNKVKLLKER